LLDLLLHRILILPRPRTGLSGVVVVSSLACIAGIGDCACSCGAVGAGLTRGPENLATAALHQLPLPVVLSAPALFGVSWRAAAGLSRGDE
jgi:hypothetical protein